MSQPAAPVPVSSIEASLEARGWSRPSSSNFLKHTGPAWMKVDADGFRLGFVVADLHDNTQGRSHGGMIMTLCDDGMGHAAQAARASEQLFTVSFECQFIAGARRGEFVEAICEVVKTTRSLVFMRCTCVVGERIVATASGIWKVLGK